jgi:hypothetical protein
MGHISAGNLALRVSPITAHFVQPHFSDQTAIDQLTVYQDTTCRNSPALRSLRFNKS